jgi:hypothetical protein
VAARWCRDTIPGLGPVLDRALSWSRDTAPEVDETVALIRRACAAASVATSG